LRSVMSEPVPRQVVRGCLLRSRLALPFST